MSAIRTFARDIMTNFSYGIEEIGTSLDLEASKSLIDCMIDIKEKPENFKPKLNTLNLDYFGLKGKQTTVLLLTGGLDSTIAYYRLLEEGYENVLPVYVDFGQPYAKKELKALDALNLPYFYFKDAIPVWYDGPWEHIIPARNLYFLALASEMLVDGGEVWISSVAGETPNYGGDKSLAFYTQFEELVANTTDKTIIVRCMNEYTKSGWVKWFLEKALLDNLSREEKIYILKTTVSCFTGHGHLNCGKCRACLRKWISLARNDIACEEIFEVHPYHGANALVEEYKNRIHEALTNEDFSYFTKDRCHDTLSVFKKFEQNLES